MGIQLGGPLCEANVGADHEFAGEHDWLLRWQCADPASVLRVIDAPDPHRSIVARPVHS
jgi:hypothetical protein